jgi:hypothetical protein
MRYAASAVVLLVGTLMAGQVRGANPTNSEKTVKAGQVTGIIKSVSASDKSIRLEVTYTYTTLNQGAYNSMLQAQRALAQARFKRTPRERLRATISAQARLARAKRDLYKVNNKKEEVTFEATDDVKVRAMKPPEQFDDKGNLKKLTREELRKLKGPNPRLPGYTAEFDSLMENQIVTVHLVKKKGRPRIRGKTKDKDALLEILADYSPKVSMIVIVR